jgi:hypothetical protein
MTTLSLWRCLRRDHPIATRESQHPYTPIPSAILKLSDPMKMISYAAMIHGLLFIVSLMEFNQINAMLGGITIFVTPFGMIFTLAFLHTLFYWITLIGVCNYMTRSLTREMTGGAWTLLRLTPYSVSEILLAKMGVVLRLWSRPVRTLIITRAILLALGLTAALLPYGQYQDNAITHPPMNVQMSFLFGAMFLVQPAIDVVAMGCLSLLSAMLIRNQTWSQVGTYALGVLVFGGMGVLSALWMMLQSPLGQLSGLLIPLSHWGGMVAAVTPGASVAEIWGRLGMFSVVLVLSPLMVGLGAFWWTVNRGKQTF